MARTVGLDLHKESIAYHILDEEGRTAGKGRVVVDRLALARFATQILQPTDHVAVEATTNTWAVVDILSPHVAVIVVSNPMLTKAIASAKVKTDKIDARVLADLLRCNYLPEVWQPDAQTRLLRSMVSRCTALGKSSTQIKNRIKATLAQRLIRTAGDVWTLAGRGWLRRVELDPYGRLSVDSDLRLLEVVEEEIAALEKEIAKVAYEKESVKILMTIPRVGLSTACALVAAWGDVNRFAEADKAASALGLVPATRQSADKCYHGPITKQGNVRARWMLVQAAQRLDIDPGPLGVSFRKMLKRKPRNVVVVAHARRLAVIAWHMLKNREPYRYAPPTSTSIKLAKLRVTATGKQRRPGPRPKRPDGKFCAEPMPTNLENPFLRLATVYERENLPPVRTIAELSPGERRALARVGKLALVEQLQNGQKAT